MIPFHKMKNGFTSPNIKKFQEFGKSLNKVSGAKLRRIKNDDGVITDFKLMLRLIQPPFPPVYIENFRILLLD